MMVNPYTRSGVISTRIPPDHLDIKVKDHRAGVEAIIPEVAAVLPQPPTTCVRPGVGFIIIHEAHGATYCVANWWDAENELVARVFIRRYNQNEAWRPAVLGESVCVWDLEVIWFERNLYVDKILSRPTKLHLADYVAEHFCATHILREAGPRLHIAVPLEQVAIDLVDGVVGDIGEVEAIESHEGFSHWMTDEERLDASKELMKLLKR